MMMLSFLMGFVPGLGIGCDWIDDGVPWYLLYLTYLCSRNGIPMVWWLGSGRLVGSWIGFEMAWFDLSRLGLFWFARYVLF